MILFRLLAAAADHIRRRWPLALVAATAAALAAGGVVFLVGDSVSRNEDLVRSLRSPMVRTITFRAEDDTAEPLLPGVAVNDLAQLDGVEHAVAFSKVRSASVAGFEDPSVSVGFFTAVALRGGSPYQLVSGREPGPGEVIVSRFAAEQLRLTQTAAGAIQVGGEVVAVVGSYESSNLGGITDLLDRSVVAPASATSGGFFSLVVVVREPADVATVVDSARLLLARHSTATYTVDFDENAIAVEALVARTGNSNVQSTALGIVLVGALVEMLVAFLNALLQRREIARRRALGYTRGQVLGTLVIEGTLLSIAGGLVGMAVALAALVANGEAVQLGQSLSTVALITVIGAVATVPGGALGAFQDPARILRVP